LSESPLSGIRVLELAQDVAGAYAAKLLGDLGAEVIKVEPPDGDPARSFGPFPGNTPDPEASGLYLYLNAGKRGIVLYLTDDSDRSVCLQLVAATDAVIESFPPGELERLRLGPSTLLAARASLVLVSITPFGQWGPKSTWRGNDLIGFHSSGFAHGFPALQVDTADLAPLNAPTYAAELLAGQSAAAAALHGLLAAQQTGHGSHLDVSLQEAIAAANNSQFNTTLKAGRAQRVFSDQPTNATVALLPCSDGWVAISPREEHQWLRWLEVMGSPAWADEPRFADRAARERNWAALYPLLAQWSRSHSKNDLFEAAQARRVACYPLGTATDLLASPQLAARGFFVEVEDGKLGVVTLPGRPYHVTGLDGVHVSALTRAPRLGQHTAEILAQLPASATDAVELRRDTPQVGNVAALDLGTVEERVLRPLEGVRVVDFSWVLTGPICTRLLAALGAEVIKVESAARPDLSHRDLAWEELNPSKRSVTLNLKESRAVHLARALIARSDVVVENFSTGVMERLGLDYASLLKANPRIIMASSSALGRTGPERERVAYGTLIQCFTGWATLSAHPGRPPRSSGGIWTDPLTAAFETVLVLAAIWRQRASGVGGFFDLSMAEATICSLPEPILAWCLNQEILEPRGNRHPRWAPQGCYPAAGDDRWVALSVQSDTEWMALCRLLGRDDLLADLQLRTVKGRHVQHDTIDLAIAAWTAARTAPEAAECLQAHGIAATPTFEPTEVVHDAHLAERCFAARVERLDGSVSATLGIPWLIDGQRPNQFRRPPRFGEDNAYVFQGLLGLGDDEYNELRAEQVIY
jgi:crotonobetainyl-CoA:carnitine CoA-transferase CaiB-like acyl-CoA transferase